MFTSLWLLDIIISALLLYGSACLLAWALQERFIFFPTLEKEDFNYQLPVPSEEFKIQTPNQGSINLLKIKSQDPKGLIFYLHGNTGSIKRWRFMGEELSTYGFDVMIPDYRGYGKSTGKRKESWMQEDMLFCLHQVEKTYTDLPVVVYGRSLGSGFAVPLALNGGADALVLETPFYSLMDVAISYFPLIPMRFLLRYRMRSDKLIKELNIPILILHGNKDRIVP